MPQKHSDRSKSQTVTNFGSTNSEKNDIMKNGHCDCGANLKAHELNAE